MDKHGVPQWISTEYRVIMARSTGLEWHGVPGYNSTEYRDIMARSTGIEWHGVPGYNGTEYRAIMDSGIFAGRENALGCLASYSRRATREG